MNVRYSAASIDNDEVLALLDYAEAEMPGYTQERAIAFALGRISPGWACGTAFLQAYIPTYAQRVSEYNKKHDHVIASRPCLNQSHRHRGTVHEYQMEADSE